MLTPSFLAVAVNQIPAWNGEHVRFVQDQVDRIEQAIAEQMTEHPQTHCSRTFSSQLFTEMLPPFV